MAVLNGVRIRLHRLVPRRCTARRLRVGLAAAWLLVMPGGPALAQEQNEPALRAAMVHKLMLFVEWPAAVLGGDEMQLCLVSGSVDLSRAFNTLHGKRVRGRTLRVQRRGELTALSDCHAVYFDGLDPSLLADKARALASLPVLTISSEPGGVAMIDLALVDSRLVFDVSATALRAAGLALAARVMQLARTVHRP